MKKHLIAALAVGLTMTLPAYSSTPARILVNHVGYNTNGPKHAIVQSTTMNSVGTCTLRTYPNKKVVQELDTTHASTVTGWHNWRFWQLRFSQFNKTGQYIIQCSTGLHDTPASFSSFPFRIQNNALARHTLQPVISYFKASRVAGAMNKADSHIKVKGQPDHAPIDARGGWYDATGDYGVHFSQLDYTSYFNTQQVPLVAFALARSYELYSAQHNSNFDQTNRRLLAGATFGADFLVRMHVNGGSFYETISAPGPEKKAEDRRIAPVMTRFGIKKSSTDEQFRVHVGDNATYEVSFRSGGGFSIAALAIAARLPWSGHFDKKTYLNVAENAFTYLRKNNKSLTNDGKENILDDFSALLAASELYRTTNDAQYRTAANTRANNLINRLSSDSNYKNYWRRGGKGSGPFYHPSDAGAPVIALLNFYPQASTAMQAKIKNAVKRSLMFQLALTHAVNNPFGYAREYVITKSKGRRAAFFFPHDTRTAPWWQGENARIASLATAARLARPLFKNDKQLADKLSVFATDQLNWILGLNPYDASMMDGVGHNNPVYLFFKTWQYTERPGGIVNGITGGFKNGVGIAYNLPLSVTKGDHSWRWNEQWLPHDAWYLLAIAAHNKTLNK